MEFLTTDTFPSSWDPNAFSWKWIPLWAEFFVLCSDSFHLPKINNLKILEGKETIILCKLAVKLCEAHSFSGQGHEKNVIEGFGHFHSLIVLVSEVISSELSGKSMVGVLQRDNNLFLMYLTSYLISQILPRLPIPFIFLTCNTHITHACPLGKGEWCW